MKQDKLRKKQGNFCKKFRVIHSLSKSSPLHYAGCKRGKKYVLRQRFVLIRDKHVFDTKDVPLQFYNPSHTTSHDFEKHSRSL